MSYRMTAPEVKNAAGHLGLQLLLEAAKRLPKTSSGFVRSDCAELMREAGRDADYCLDAPDELPAGACYGFDLEDDEFGIVPAQITVGREE